MMIHALWLLVLLNTVTVPSSRVPTKAVYFERGGLCSCLFSYLIREGSMTVPVHPIQYWYISRYVMIQFRYSNEETVLITFQIHLPFRLHDSIWWWWGCYSYYYYYFDVCYCYQRSHSLRSSAYFDYWWYDCWYWSWYVPCPPLFIFLFLVIISNSNSK